MPDEPPLDAATELLRLRYHSRLTQRQIALATGVKAGVVTGWLRGTRHPRGPRADRLVALGACVGELARYLPPDQVAAWLTRPLERHGATALELIAADQADEVAADIEGFGREEAS